MPARFAPCVLLLIALSACAQTGQERTDAREESPAAAAVDPIYRHARESEAWRVFDVQLRALYEARRMMRDSYRLPGEAPSTDDAIEIAAWDFARAAERNTLAYMVTQEVLNDLEHCRHALQIAEDAVEPARAASAEAMETMTAAVRNLHGLLETGDRAANLRTLEAFASELPDHYRELLKTLGENDKSP